MEQTTSTSADVESARKVCARLHQAYRDHRLYPEGHPSIRSTMDLLIAALESHLDPFGPLVLQVDEDRLLQQGEVVYTHEESRDNLAFLMFRDGIRVLTLSPGIEAREVEVFVDCLTHADQMVDTDHDLSTVLWERDLAHVTTEVVDPFLQGEGVQDDAFNQLRETVLRRLNELSSVDTAEAEATSSADSETDPSAGGGSLERKERRRVDEEDIALTEEEIERGEWLASHPSDPLDDFALVLLEIVADSSGLPAGIEAVVRSLSLVVGKYLDEHRLDGVELVMDRLSVLEEQGRCGKGLAEHVFSEAATAGRLGALITAAVSTSAEKAVSVAQFLARMRRSLFRVLLETMAASNDRAVRKVVLGTLQLEGGVPGEHLWPFMKDSRWYVVRNAVQLATISGEPELVDHLEPLVSHPDERVRREVIRSLGIVGHARCLPLLANALEDGDSTVRILAVRGVLRQGDQQYFSAVKAHVEARNFDELPPEEIEAFLTAYAALGAENTVGTLNKMWKRRFFGSRSLPVRLAAVKALGVIGTTDARRALSEAAKCGEVSLQRMAAQALSGVKTEEPRGESE